MTERNQATPSLRAELYAAFLQAAIAMGDDLKSLSWFGRNHRKRK